MLRKTFYLGDGLYVVFDGFMVTLRAPREHGDHWVALEPEVLRNFLTFLRTNLPEDFRGVVGL